MKIAGILLAAGNSTRFGENKLLYPVEGKAMYEYALENLASLPLSSVCVVTQYKEIEQKAKKMGLTVVHNPDPWRGISFSLILGIQASCPADAYLFAVGDQPWMKRETLYSFLEFYKNCKKGIASVGSRKRLGNPCIFADRYRRELLELQGDTGGKKVILAHKDDLAVYQVEEERELMDLDYRI